MFLMWATCLLVISKQWLLSNCEQVKILFQQIQDAIHQRKLSCFVGHIREHSNLIGPLAESNAIADKLT